MKHLTHQLLRRPLTAGLTRGAALLTLCCALLTPAIPARADYKYLCLRQEGEFKASLIVEMLSRENPNGLDTFMSDSKPVWTRQFFTEGLREGKLECVFPAGIWKPGDRIRVSAVVDGNKTFCISEAKRHEGFFLIPDREARRLVFQTSGDYDDPECVLSSKEATHSECTRGLESMRNLGCAQWAPDPDETTLHDIVAEKLGLAVLGSLLDHGADINETENGDTPLTAAVKGDLAEYANALTQLGADLNASDEDGRTPLLLAVMGGNEEIVENLLKNGADPNLADHGGISPLYAAHNADSPSMAELLAQHGADWNQRPHEDAQQSSDHWPSRLSVFFKRSLSLSGLNNKE